MGDRLLWVDSDNSTFPEAVIHYWRNRMKSMAGFELELVASISACVYESPGSVTWLAWWYVASGVNTGNAPPKQMLKIFTSLSFRFQDFQRLYMV